MTKSGLNTTLTHAKKNKKDEFYTQLSDIERELKHYKEHFKNKVVYCNCDDPRVSNFFHYFSYNFEKLGLKKLVATCYKNQDMDLFSQNSSEQAIYLEYEGDKNGNCQPDFEEIAIKHLKGDGDFRSAECINLLKQADIVVTNPPFSLFREYVSQLIKHDKKFVIVGHQNAITYKEIFPLIKGNKLWLGHGFKGGAAHFINKHYEDYATAGDRKEGMIRVSGVVWFTNLDISKRHEDLILYKKYIAIKHLKGDGDFRSAECINLLKQADIVVTNPPFSLFREYVSQLIEYDKKFLVIGNINAITYKEIFKLIKENKAWLGVNMGRGISGFIVPSSYELYGTEARIDETGNRIISTNNCLWLTNLDTAKRHEDIILYKKYNSEEYPKYDNYDAINVDKTKDIPMDYEGVMGVPITFLHKYNPDQFEILGCSYDYGRPEGWSSNIKMSGTINGVNVYKRLLIRNKKVIK